jgi:hypothetical protein
MVALVLTLVAFIALGVAAVRGWLPDTRDPEFSLGRVLHGRSGPTPAKPDPANVAARTNPPAAGSSASPDGAVATHPARRRSRLAHA